MPNVPDLKTIASKGPLYVVMWNSNIFIMRLIKHAGVCLHWFSFSNILKLWLAFLSRTVYLQLHHGISGYIHACRPSIYLWKICRCVCTLSTTPLVDAAACSCNSSNRYHKVILCSSREDSIYECFCIKWLEIFQLFSYSHKFYRYFKLIYNTHLAG